MDMIGGRGREEEEEEACWYAVYYVVGRWGILSLLSLLFGGIPYFMLNIFVG